MIPAKSIFLKILCLFLSWEMAMGYAARVASSPQLEISCSNPKNLENANPEYVKTLSEALIKLGAQKVNCVSCYRSPEDQRKACKKVCGNENGCPNLCAPPGRSQHQRMQVATCDLKGMPRGSCWSLKKLCDEKYGGKCGIGGYPGGGYHFGVNDYRFSSWNKCAGLPKERGATAPAPGADDPSPGSGTGSELDAQELSSSHAIIIVAAAIVAGAGGAYLIDKWRKSK